MSESNLLHDFEDEIYNMQYILSRYGAPEGSLYSIGLKQYAYDSLVNKLLDDDIKFEELVGRTDKQLVIKGPAGMVKIFMVQS